MATFHPSLGAGSEESVDSLQDVLTPQDQAHLEQVLRSSEPYNTLEGAYDVARGISVLGVTDATRKVVHSR